jgi:hypothetical protein
MAKNKETGRTLRRRNSMPALLEAPKAQGCGSPDSGATPVSLNDLVVAMGKRFQAEYIEGAIPYLRQSEPKLWAQLEALDQEESLEALLAYERLFFEGLRRYLCRLEAQRQAA